MSLNATKIEAAFNDYATVTVELDNGRKVTGEVVGFSLAGAHADATIELRSGRQVVVNTRECVVL